MGASERRGDSKKHSIARCRHAPWPPHRMVEWHWRFAAREETGRPLLLAAWGGGGSLGDNDAATQVGGKKIQK